MFMSGNFTLNYIFYMTNEEFIGGSTVSGKLTTNNVLRATVNLSNKVCKGLETLL